MQKICGDMEEIKLTKSCAIQHGCKENVRVVSESLTFPVLSHRKQFMHHTEGMVILSNLWKVRCVHTAEALRYTLLKSFSGCRATFSSLCKLHDCIDAWCTCGREVWYMQLATEKSAMRKYSSVAL